MSQQWQDPNRQDYNYSPRPDRFETAIAFIAGLIALPVILWCLGAVITFPIIGVLFIFGLAAGYRTLRDRLLPMWPALRRTFFLGIGASVCMVILLFGLCFVVLIGSLRDMK